MSAGAADRAAKSAALDKRDYWTIAAIALLAAIPRGFLLCTLPPLLHQDSDSYFEIARRIWRGGGFGDLSRRTPLYPIFLSLFAQSPNLGFLPVTVVQHLLGAGGAVLLYLIARRVLGPNHRWAALIASAISALAIFPVAIEQSVLAEPLFSFLLLAAAWAALVWAGGGKARYAASAGGLLGLATLTKPVAAGLLPLWTVLLFIVEGRKKALAFFRPAFAAFALPVVPLLARNASAMGRVSLTESLGRNLISVADRFADFESEPNLAVKRVYKEFMADKRGPDAVVVYAAMPRLRAATGLTDAAIDRALVAIAWEGVRAHPVEFAASRLRRLPVLWRDPAGSLWQTLHEETYFPMVTALGRGNPEMVARSVAAHPLQSARFDLARWWSRGLGWSFPSGPWMVFALIGIPLTLWRGDRVGSALLASLVVYLWLTSIFLQPPNARYRLPSYSLEVLFAVAAISIVVERLGSRLGLHQPSPRTLSWIAATAALAFVLGRMAAAYAGRPVLVLGGSMRDADSDRSPVRFGDPGNLIREISAAGKTLPVLYWTGSEDGAGEIAARVPAEAGERYRLFAAYSCSSRACAGGELTIAFRDRQGALLREGAPRAIPLSHDRDDNDLFWDQVSFGFVAPNSAASMEVRLTMKPGGGVAMPLLRVETTAAGMD